MVKGYCDQCGEFPFNKDTVKEVYTGSGSYVTVIECPICHDDVAPSME